MVKKLLLSLVALIYLANVSGASLRLHYCMGKLVRIGVMADGKKECSHCGMDKAGSASKHCCKDEQKKVSSDTDVKAVIASMHYLKAPQGFQADIKPDFTCPVFIPSNAICFPVSNAPPAEKRLYLLFNVFRI